MHKILILRLSSLGDVVLTMPLVASLREKFPDAQLWYLTTRPYQKLVTMNPSIDRVESIDSYHGWGWFTSLYKAVKLFRKEKFDMVVDLHFNHWSYMHATIWLFIFTRCVGALQRVKAQRPPFQRGFMHQKNAMHVWDWYGKSLQRYGIRKPFDFSSTVFRVDRAHAGKYLSERGIMPHERLIGFAPEASWPHKQWDTENFREVSRSLRQFSNTKVVLFTQNAQTPLSAYFKEGFPEDSLLHIGGFALDHVASFLTQCRFLITNDSGLMHLASALGVPVVAVFGPTHPCLGYSPRGMHARVLYSDSACSPCSRWGEKRCRLGKKVCFNHASVENVVSYAQEYLQKN